MVNAIRFFMDFIGFITINAGVKTPVMVFKFNTQLTNQKPPYFFFKYKIKTFGP